jgi:hypothetical protein
MICYTPFPEIREGTGKGQFNPKTELHPDREAGFTLRRQDDIKIVSGPTSVSPLTFFCLIQTAQMKRRAARREPWRSRFLAVSQAIADRRLHDEWK